MKISLISCESLHKSKTWEDSIRFAKKFYLESFGLGRRRRSREVRFGKVVYAEGKKIL